MDKQVGDDNFSRSFIVGIIMSGWLGAANYGVIVANDLDKFLSSGGGL